MSSGEHTLVPEEGEEGWYDPELPFLQALERDVRRHARHVAATRERAHATREHNGVQRPSVSHSNHDGRAHAGEPRLRPAGTRVARRSLALLALLSLIGASAFGATRIFAGSSPPDPATVHQSAFVTLAGGSAGSDRWSLRTYVRGTELCRVLAVGEAESSRCSTTGGAHSLGATSVLSPTHRYLFGIAGSAIAAVTVHGPGGFDTRVPTYSLPASASASTRLHRGERWYVAVLARPIGAPDPALRVHGLDRGGVPVGAAVIDCPETAEPNSCPR